MTLALAWSLGCSAPSPPAPPPTSLTQPAFSDPADEALHDRLLDFASELGPAEPRRRGSCIERRWAEGEARIPPKVPAPDARRVDLGVFHRNGSTRSFGVHYRAAATDAAGHSARVSLTTGGQDLQGDGLSLVLTLPDGTAAPFGLPLSHRLGERTITSAPRPDRDELVATARLYRDPQTLVPTAAAQLEALEAAITQALDSKDFPVCDPQPGPRPSVPGPCIVREPHDDEVTALRTRFDAELAERRRVLNAAPKAWSALMERLLPTL